MGTPQPSQGVSRASLQRALTPSMSLPLVAVQRSSALEHKANGRHSSVGATDLLAKVASSPPTPSLLTPPASNHPSPQFTAPAFSRRHSAPGSHDSDSSEWSPASADEDMCQRGEKGQYFSFPDFERFGTNTEEDMASFGNIKR